MFTGIIEGLGLVKSFNVSNDGGRLLIKALFKFKNVNIGDSIAINGVCLTVVEINGEIFQYDVSIETLKKTTFYKIRVGDFVNLERALKFSGRLNGHLVLGHIDGVANIRKKRVIGNSTVINFEVSKLLLKHIIIKGSVAIDGVSLTINQGYINSFDVNIVPHTIKMTNINKKNVGDLVNIETDIIGKYIDKFMGEYNQKSEIGNTTHNSVNRFFLLKNGFV